MAFSPKVFTPQSFQRSFVLSTAAFPARVAPWGDGKTLCAIVKGMQLSEFYPGNEGLVIRRRYNALQRSTIRDFEFWTGMTVPEQKKCVKIPGCDSMVHFSHAENLEEFRLAIQGMNLGWAVIEQADEFENADVFEMLIGRLRRILTPNRQIQGELIKLGVLKHYSPDFSVFTAQKREELEQAIIERLGLPVRQIILIANTCGHNWMWKRWKRPLIKAYDHLPGYVLYEGQPFENTRYVPQSTLRNWETLKKTSPKKYNRYVLNSWEDYDIEGAYYAELMSDALKEGRCEIDGLHDRTARVHTFWDLGVRGSDSTSIWFIQFVKDEIRAVDFYGGSGKGMDHYSQVLSEKGYEYAAHWLPHDAHARIQGPTITTRLDILRRLRPHEDVHIVERHSLAERHEATRSLLNKCKFDSKCEKGVEALNLYHREINKVKSSEEVTVFLDQPAKDQYSHPADAFGYMAIVYRYQSIDDELLGEAEAYLDSDGDFAGVTNLLEVG